MESIDTLFTSCHGQVRLKIFRNKNFLIKGTQWMTLHKRWPGTVMACTPTLKTTFNKSSVNLLAALRDGHREECVRKVKVWC